MTNNNPTNLEIIKQACVKANPSIAEDPTSLCATGGKQCYEGCTDHYREITLADVLLALVKRIYCTIDHNNPSFFLIMNKESTHPRAEWDLTKPLEGQSEDTLNFLAQLHDDKGLCDEGPERSSCQKSESPVTPKLSDCKYCYGKGYYTVASGGNITYGDFLGDAPYNVPLTIEKHPCPRCTVKEDKLDKTTQPVGGVSGNKPSTGEDWEKELEMFDFPTAWRLVVLTKKEYHHEKCSWRQAQLLCDCAGVEMARLARNDLKEYIRSLLQKERERIAGICETVKRDDKAYFGAFQRGYHKGVETVKQQILKDNQ